MCPGGWASASRFRSRGMERSEFSNLSFFLDFLPPCGKSPGLGNRRGGKATFTDNNPQGRNRSQADPLRLERQSQRQRRERGVLGLVSGMGEDALGSSWFSFQAISLLCLGERAFGAYRWHRWTRECALTVGLPGEDSQERRQRIDDSGDRNILDHCHILPHICTHFHTCPCPRPQTREAPA
jgi:hypothetical protein